MLVATNLLGVLRPGALKRPNYLWNHIWCMRRNPLPLLKKVTGSTLTHQLRSVLVVESEVGRGSRFTVYLPGSVEGTNPGPLGVDSAPAYQGKSRSIAPHQERPDFSMTFNPICGGWYPPPVHEYVTSDQAHPRRLATVFALDHDSSLI